MISVIIPTYNAQNDIEECLASVYSQTHQNIEVICIDNNSTDKTWYKLQELQSKYPNLIIDKEPRQGASSARNKGLSIAKGKWIQFLDADDLLLPEKIIHQIKLIKKHKADLIAGAYRKEFLNQTHSEIKPHNDFFYGIFTTNFGITSSNLWNKNILNIIGSWNEKLQSSQEYDLMFRYIQQTQNVYIDTEINTIIRERAGSISKTNKEKNIERFVNLRVEIFNYLKQNKPDYFRQNLQKYHQALFDFIRTLYPYNNSKALEFYYEHIPKKFNPNISSATTESYLFLYKILGFKKTEQLKQFIKRK